jgi:predicted lipoprotein with Yx(FWY)xxD motif
MRQFANQRPSALPLRVALVALALSALPVPAFAGAAKSMTVAKLAVSAAYDKPVIVSVKGRTLYTLSSEKSKVVCVDACLSAWPPLTVPAGVKPKGPVPLGTEERPDGRMQVTYKGFPLYTFSGDKKRGDASGEGIKGNGTWHAAQAPQFISGPAEPTPPPPRPSNP